MEAYPRILQMFQKLTRDLLQLDKYATKTTETANTGARLQVPHNMQKYPFIWFGSDPVLGYLWCVLRA